MIVAHLSDLHLGYQAYESTESGGNLRERDVARAFQKAVAEIVRVEPDVVLVSGDVFDRPEPTAGALVTLARGLENLRSALPSAPVLMVAGARDTPRSWGDPGALAALDTFSNVEAATGTPRSVWIEDGRAHVFLLPHRSVLHRPHPQIRPDPRARWNVLVAHGDVRLAGHTGLAGLTGSGGYAENPGSAGDDRHAALAGVEGPEDEDSGGAPGSSPRPAGPPVEIDKGDWDYVALGHDHGFRKVASGVVYSGSLERVGPEPWTEAHRSKGFVVADLSTGDVDFREIAGRPVVALAPIRWDPDRPRRMNERIREVRAEIPGGMAGKIVRLRLEGMGPEGLRSLDGELLSALRREAVHLAVEVVRDAGPEPRTSLPVLDRVVDRLEASGSEEEGLLEASRALLSESPPTGSPSP